MAGNSETREQSEKPHVHNPRFARQYERLSQSRTERTIMEPLRRELVEQAYGVVLEIGAGTGLNFPFYLPEKVRQVEAIEPDATMLGYARTRREQARVSLNLTRAPAEDIPFPDSVFDCAVATLVFCSVGDPMRGFREIQRVLKPGGKLLLLEHVRAHNRLAAGIQDFLVPLTTRFCGNCHWNRETGQTVKFAGFQIQQERSQGGPFLPMLLLQATSGGAI